MALSCSHSHTPLAARVRCVDYISLGVQRCCLFDVSVLQVHGCVWLGCDPREENLPPCRNMLWNIFQVAAERQTWKLKVRKDECWWTELVPTVKDFIQGGELSAVKILLRHVKSQIWSDIFGVQHYRVILEFCCYVCNFQHKFCQSWEFCKFASQKNMTVKIQTCLLYGEI